MKTDPSSIPVIDLGPLATGGDGAKAVASAIGEACRRSGFFYAVGHGVSPVLFDRLESASRRFFAEPLASKLAIRMELGGRAWRGYFPLGSELTSGRPDAKEGIYFGAELGEDDPEVAAGTPLHGRNLFPETVPELREAVLAYLAVMTDLGQRLMAGVALSLGLGPGFFREGLTRRPLVLFRVFHYPPLSEEEDAWSVGEHTDYGLLTILHQDRSGGLQVKARAGGGWIEAPPIEGSFVCNIGDMLDRMTGGLYRSTPHRVRNASGRPRLSFPFFFDPGWRARVAPITTSAIDDDYRERWDRASVHAFRGTYGEYLLGKVSRVFPELFRDVV